MSRPKSKIKVVCQNNSCSFYRKEQGKNITKQGKNKAHHERYKCWHCNKYFVETKGTPLYNKKMSERKIKMICKNLVEKQGIRAVERIMGVHRDTICNLLDDLASHASEMTNHLVNNLGMKSYEVDELWTFVKKNKRKLSKEAIAGLEELRQQSLHV